MCVTFETMEWFSEIKMFAMHTTLIHHASDGGEFDVSAETGLAAATSGMAMQTRPATMAQQQQQLPPQVMHAATSSGLERG